MPESKKVFGLKLVLLLTGCLVLQLILTAIKHSLVKGFEILFAILTHFMKFKCIMNFKVLMFVHSAIAL